MQAQVLNELNIKELQFIEDESTLHSFVIKPNLAKLGPKFGKRLPHIQQALSSANAEEVGAKVAAGGPIELSISEEHFTLAPEDLLVQRAPVAGLVVASDNGCLVALDTRLTPDLIREGIARDFVRYIQDLRKKANFNVSDRITIHYVVDGEAAEAITQHANYIQQETLADELSVGEPPEGSTVVTPTLAGQPVQVGVVRVQTVKQ